MQVNSKVLGQPESMSMLRTAREHELKRVHGEVTGSWEMMVTAVRH